jgi:sugar phosphate isomerase/epimerase
VPEVFDTAGPWLRHFHASEPYLAPPGTTGAPHADYAAALRRIGFKHWVSIEMRAPADAARVLDQVASALAYVGQIYGGPG